GVGTAVPPDRYTQEQVLELFQVTDSRIRSLFVSGAIQGRHLCLPPPATDGTMAVETQGELLHRHRTAGLELGTQALTNCLKRAGHDLADIGYLCCVTSTGWLTPGFTALLSERLGLSRGCGRLDVVGMGCNAGLNGLNAVATWTAAHPGELAVLVCVEVCSAAYVFDGTMRTSVVNSLFGDGAAALAVVGGRLGQGPAVLRFASRLIPEALSAMRYDWDDGSGKFSFYIDRDVPYVVGAHAEAVVDELLAGTGVRRREVAHWIVHSGGKKVVDAVKVNLGLTAHDVRHTSTVLHDCGNLSSGSFLFSFERLLDEGAPAPGDYGVMMTMGPGSTIETALLQW
ncbi:MAG TPA: 3,5-dihydroxyphenylacetyl-CoA synthase DpgA, partial [Micromonosporaceae bacterium]|nr:3,5-dihydroxyphenylacetyl-CoA synthase DpgA [Micromonosporaceae bacterium]